MVLVVVLMVVQVVDAVRLAQGVHNENERADCVLGVNDCLRVLQ